MIYHYYGGGSTGVARFDSLLRRVFPDMQSVTAVPSPTPDDVVITDNHQSCELPPAARVLVVHHGCARTHYDRDPAWRNERTRHIVELQAKMFDYPNRTFVAPSDWVREQFGGNARMIPHWVEPIEWTPNRSETPMIIGDWRGWNKGAAVWPRLARICPEWYFEPLSFKEDGGRRRQYGEASLYLCLSLSEGGSYSMCDAEATGLPIVTTDVGNYREFSDAEVIPWQQRDNVELVIAAIERKLRTGRQKPSFYENYTFEHWAEAWRNVIR